MNPALAIATLTLLGAHLSGAQNVTEALQVDPVLEAIREFSKRDKEKPNEVAVVLDPVGQSPAPLLQEPKSVPAPPVLVTGKPPEGTDPAKDPGMNVPRPENGLAVRIEKLHAGKGSIDPAQVKLLAPFPAKPLAQPPEGWRLDASDSAPPLTREVELAPGSKITLTIRPHLLVPDADGANVFNISEPGYDNTLGYQQTATVGAILSNSNRQMDEDSKQLGIAIDSLQQLLISLPKPELLPETKPATLRKK